jgi:hypothetical protein
MAQALCCLLLAIWYIAFLSVPQYEWPERIVVSAALTVGTSIVGITLTVLIAGALGY